MSEKGRTEEFLDLYRKLEHIGREIYFPNSNNAPIIGRLQALPVLKEFKEEIDYCRVVRNFLVHNPKVNGAYPIAPSIYIQQLWIVKFQKLRSIWIPMVLPMYLFLKKKNW